MAAGAVAALATGRGLRPARAAGPARSPVLVAAAARVGLHRHPRCRWWSGCCCGEPRAGCRTPRSKPSSPTSSRGSGGPPPTGSSPACRVRVRWSAVSRRARSMERSLLGLIVVVTIVQVVALLLLAPWHGGPRRDGAPSSYPVQNGVTSPPHPCRSPLTRRPAARVRRRGRRRHGQLIVLPVAAHRWFGLSAVAAFWISYVLTRPRSARPSRTGWDHRRSGRPGVRDGGRRRPVGTDYRRRRDLPGRHAPAPRSGHRRRRGYVMRRRSYRTPTRATSRAHPGRSLWTAPNRPPRESD